MFHTDPPPPAPWLLVLPVIDFIPSHATISYPIIPLSYPMPRHSMLITLYCTILIMYRTIHNTIQYHTIQSKAIQYYTIQPAPAFIVQKCLPPSIPAFPEAKESIKCHKLPTQLWHRTSCNRCGCFFAPPEDAKHHCLPWLPLFG